MSDTKRQFVGPVLAVAALAAGCGDTPAPRDDVRAAVEEYLAALRNRDVDTVCRKLFPSTLLPQDAAEQFDIAETSTDAATAGWDEEARRCRSDFGRNGEFESAAPPSDLSVTTVTRVAAFRPVQGISDAAEVRVHAGGRSDSMPVVRFDDDWKIVFIVR
jgi:hypothetical protein